MIQKIFKSKKIEEQLNQSQKLYEEIVSMDNSIKEELKRCEEISKNPKTLELLSNWQKEYGSLKESLKEIDSQYEEIKQLSKEKRTKDFMLENQNFSDHIEYLNPFIKSFYDKLKNYTNYEIENTEMALNLKERLKEVTNLFDQKIRIIEVYNSVFVEETSQIKMLIKKFEEEQKKGNYPRARLVLKDCNDYLVKLENNVILLVEYYEIMYNVEEKINALKKMKNLVEEQELKEFAKNVEEECIKRQNQREELVEKAKKYSIMDSDNLGIGLNEVKYFEEQIDNYNLKINEDYALIINIFEVKKDNEKHIELVEQLMQGAVEEKNKIEKLYSLEDISHFDKTLEEKERFEQFKLDYAELNKIFKGEISNFKIHEEKFRQSNKFLLRLLGNVKFVIEGLEAVRSDEIEIREKLHIYKKELININLYLRENIHLDKLDTSLESMYKEIVQKIAILEEELEKEPLDIGNVRINNDIIEKLLRKLILDIETDIKQRKGVEKLILYYNRFITNQENLEYYKHFLSLYNEKNYRQVLREIHEIFLQMDSRGDQLYKSIVSKVEIKDYKSII